MTSPKPAAEPLRIPAQLPFLVVMATLALAAICAASVQLTERVPASPWEPAVALEAVRLNAGLPVYEAGHATHMYGPLLTVLFGAVFQIFGLNLLAIRIVMSVLAFALAIGMAVLLSRGKSAGDWLLAVLLFLAINFRTNLVFLSTQPDCVAALLAVGAIYFWITRANSLFRASVSVAFFVCAMLFKQTSAAFALIPVVHVLVWRRPVRVRDLIISLIPVISILLALAAIRLFCPQMFSAMVTVPGSIKVYLERALNIALYLIATFPIFFIALLSILRSRTAIIERERWILSALIVLIPISIWTVCKSGGDYNSLLFAYLAMTALFVARMDAIKSWLGSLTIERSLIAASGIAVAILLSFFVQFDRSVALLSARCGNEKYDSAIAIARRLGPGVISPQDPTIAFNANGYFGRALIFELDAHAVNGNWPSELPESVQQELAASNYVLEVKSYVPTPVFERALAKKFHAVAIPELSGSAYTLWAKTDG
jgi:hypothetical protein